MKFAKYQALGNDYVVIEREFGKSDLSAATVRRICDRHFGVGSDGLLVHALGKDEGPIRVRVFNPDGSEAEKSGNGIRIFARYLWDQHLVGDSEFNVRVSSGDVQCRVTDVGRTVSVKMGQVRFGSSEIPVLGPFREVLRESMTIDGQTVEYSAATIGNPHCIIQRDHVSATEAKSLGPIIETQPRFPNRTNVQFMEIVDRHNIRIEIWERGAGYTLASGTSSCAAAAVAKKLGLCGSSIAVHMPGGALAIEIDEEFFVRMTGPVGKVCEGRISDELVQTAAD